MPIFFCIFVCSVIFPISFLCIFTICNICTRVHFRKLKSLCKVLYYSSQYSRKMHPYLPTYKHHTIFASTSTGVSLNSTQSKTIYNN